MCGHRLYFPVFVLSRKVLWVTVTFGFFGFYTIIGYKVVTTLERVYNVILEAHTKINHARSVSTVCQKMQLITLSKLALR